MSTKKWVFAILVGVVLGSIFPCYGFSQMVEFDFGEWMILLLVAFLCLIVVAIPGYVFYSAWKEGGLGELVDLLLSILGFIDDS